MAEPVALIPKHERPSQPATLQPDEFCSACGASLRPHPASPEVVSFVSHEYEALKDMLLAGKITDAQFTLLWEAALGVAYINAV